jgi:hypothetical protein
VIPTRTRGTMYQWGAVRVETKFSFSYYRENFRFSITNTYTSCKKRWLHVLNFPLSQRIIEISIIFAIFLLRKANFLRKAKTKTFHFNSRCSLNRIVSWDFGVLFLIYLDRYKVPNRAWSGLFFILKMSSYLNF